MCFMFRNDGADVALEVNGDIVVNVYFIIGGPGGDTVAYNRGEYFEVLEEKFAESIINFVELINDHLLQIIDKPSKVL